MAIAEPDELQESVGPGADGCAWQVGVPPANHRASQSASDVAVWHIRSRGEFHERTRTSNQSNPRQSLLNQSQYAEPAFRNLQNLIFLKIVVCIMAGHFRCIHLFQTVGDSISSLIINDFRDKNLVCLRMFTKRKKASAIFS